jgi:hypothetical protein
LKGTLKGRASKFGQLFPEWKWNDGVENEDCKQLSPAA